MKFAKELTERFLRYVAIPSESNGRVGVVPSSEGQRELARLLEAELREMGLDEIELDEHAILTAKLPGNKPGAPVIGWVAHLDTVPVSLSPEVHPQILRYEGGDVCLNAEKDIWLRLSEHPELGEYVGQDIVFTDGTSVLGADDKAAIANVMTMLSALTDDKSIPHGEIRVAFVPDEEIGLCGAKLMDLEKWKVDFAYTIDCCSVGEIVYETFNAGSVLIEIEGVTAHPMSAKGVLVNPLLVGADIMACFDRKQTPEHTDGHDGYWWFWGCEANDSRCTLRMNIRDHSKENYEARKKYVQDVVDMIRVRHDRAKIKLTITDVYGNIIDALGEDRGPIDMLYQACDELGITPKTIAMRGGTDGSVLSVRGVLTPNYFTGGLNFHSNAEFLPIPSLCKSHAMTMKLIELAAR